MKLVVTGTPGLWAATMSRSAVKHSSSASLVKRRKSSACVGLTKYWARRGGTTSSHES